MFPKTTISEVHWIPRSTVWLKQKYIFPFGRKSSWFLQIFFITFNSVAWGEFIADYLYLGERYVLQVKTYKRRSCMCMCKCIFITEHRIWIAREKHITIESEHPFDVKILEEEMTGGNKFKARSVSFPERKV